MGTHIHGGTMVGAVTPICNDCGTSLCWDIGEDEYEQAKAFWDEWICQDCNGGEPLSLKDWMRSNAGIQGRAGLYRHVPWNDGLGGVPPEPTFEETRCLN